MRAAAVTVGIAGAEGSAAAQVMVDCLVHRIGRAADVHPIAELRLIADPGGGTARVPDRPRDRAAGAVRVSAVGGKRLGLVLSGPSPDSAQGTAWARPSLPSCRSASV